MTLLNSAVYAMQEALADLNAGRTPTRRVEFTAIRELVGFAGYDETLARYDAGRGRTRPSVRPPLIRDQPMSDNSYLKDFILLRNDPSKVGVVRDAAQRGEVDAQYTLGLIYAEGRGVEIDLGLAHYWLSLAVAQGDRDAEQLRNVVGSQMTDAEYELSKRLRTRCVMPARPGTH